MSGPPVKKRPRYAPQVPSDERGHDDAFEHDELPDDESDQDWVASDDSSGEEGEDGTGDGSNNSSDDQDCYTEIEHDGDGQTAAELLDRTTAGDPPARYSEPNSIPASRLSLNKHHSPEQPSISSPRVRDAARDPAERIGGQDRQSPWTEDFERDEIETSSEDNYDDYFGDEGAEEDDDDDVEDDYESDGDAGEESESDHGGDDGPANSLASADGRASGKASRVRSESSAGGRDYAQFLAAILAEDSPPAASLPGPFSSLLDDDFDADFDYLTAAAQTTEDPLEFRDDKAVHVSRREIVQLVSGAPARRRRHRNIIPAGVSGSFPASFPNPQSCYGSRALQNLSLASGTGPPIQQAALLQPRPPDGVAPVVRPWLGNVNEVISDLTFARIREQLNIHVLLLAHVHAASQDARAKSETASLLREILQMRDLSQNYKAMFEPHRREHEDTLHARVGRDPAPVETCFAIPVLDKVAGFLADSDAGVVSPNQLLERFGPFGDERIHKALAARIADIEPTSESEPGPPWTVEDDCLLAMTVAKHTMDFGDESKDLLPHREVRDCERRMRFLSSRRCGDNPVKHQVHLMTLNQTPLSKEELEIVKAGLLQYMTGFEHDESRKRDVWKLIQRDFLPHRDWRQLERTWGWRESRRVYKLRSRQKAKKQFGSA